MKRAAVVALTCLTLTGCVTTHVGKSRYPEPPANFVPKPIYPIAVSSLWQAVNTTLAQEGIAVASSNRADWRLTTEGVDGEARMAIGILGAAATATRYRFSISLAPQGRSSSMQITTILESSEDGQGQWRNVNKSYPKDVRNIGLWLTAKIEANIRK